jgi:hypothetical protein
MAYEIKDALEWYDRAISRDQHNRDDYEINQRFLAGEQWSEADQRKRGEGAVVVNKLDTPVTLVVNQVAQALPGPKVSRRDAPDTEGAAEVREGILRDIEYASSAEDRYLRQLDNATGGNVGILRLFVDYVCEDSMDRELRIGDVADPMMCVFDPEATEPDKSDMKRLILRQPMSFDEYRQKGYGDPEEAHRGFAGTPDNIGTWFDLPDKSLWVAEDWSVEYVSKTLLRVQGHDFYDDDTRTLRMIAAMNGGMIEPELSRKVSVPKIIQRIITGADVLEETVWPGKRIPFFPILGTERYCKGRRNRKSIITDARTSQKLYNYVTAQEILDFRNAPSSRFLISAEGLSGHEDQYRNINDPDETLLVYNAFNEAREPIPPPQFVRFDPNIQNYLAAKQAYEQDIQQLTRTPAAMLGESMGAQESGEKIKQLKMQSGLANSHAGRGLKLAVQAMYREIIDCLPHVYSQHQAMRIIGPDDKQSVVWINQHLADNPKPDPKTGRVRMLDLSDGRYDVIADVGPSYHTQQEETADRIVNLLPTMPQLTQLAPDVILKLLNLGPQAQEAIDRVTPEQFKEQDGQNSAQADKQRLVQLDQAAQALHQQLEQATQVIQTEQQKLDNAYKIAELNAATQIRIKEMDVDAKAAIAGVQAQLDAIAEDLKWTREKRLQETQHAHEAGLAAMDHAHTLHQNLQEHDHAVVQAEQAHEQAKDVAQTEAALSPADSGTGGGSGGAE